MYPRNAASPERIAVGPVVQISDGAVQTSGVSIAVRGQGGASGAGSGTTAYDNGIVEYTPTQGETDFTSFVVIAYKTGCIPVSQTIVTSASATAGYAGTDQGKIANPTSTVDLSGTTISSAQKVDLDTIKTNPVVNAGTVTFPTGATLASTTNITAGTITTATNLTNAPTAGDFTATMKTSIGTAVAASAVASVTGNVGGNVTGSVGSVAAGGITASSIAADAIGASELAADAVAEIAGAVWDITLSSHLTGGTTGEALNAAGAAGDPWTTTLPGAYSAGSAGYIVGTNVNATISSRLASASYTAPLDAAGVRSAVGLASANLDTQMDALPTAVENADALLKRDWTSVTGEAGRSVLNALRFLRNKWSIAAGTLTVTKEDDSTSAWTGAVSTTAGDPASGIDPS